MALRFAPVDHEPPARSAIQTVAEVDCCLIPFPNVAALIECAVVARSQGVCSDVGEIVSSSGVNGRARKSESVVVPFIPSGVLMKVSGTGRYPVSHQGVTRSKVPLLVRMG